MKLHPIVLGTDVYGTDISKKTAFSLLDCYTSLGGNVLDTARVYAAWIPGGMGKSEEVIGKWLRKSGKRNQVFISSKCAHPDVHTMHIPRLSRAEIRDDVHKSLKALGIDTIDILWLHRDCKTVPTDDIIEILNELIKEGKIRCFGASNWSAKRIAEANQYAQAHNLQGFCAGQIKWSLAKTNPNYPDDPTLVEMNPEEYSFYQKNQLGLFAFASQAKGFFSKYHQFGNDMPDSKAKKRYLWQENEHRYQMLLEYCQEHCLSIESAVVSAITSNTDFETVAIVGCKTVSQLESSMQPVVVDYPYFRRMMFE